MCENKMNNHEVFLYAIVNKKFVELTFKPKEKAMVTRRCIPFDFGPSRRKLKVNPSKYHFYDLDSPERPHSLSILSEQIIKIKLLNESFDPVNYITWKPPYNWFTKRDWGNCS
ncbi:hypothetical protein KAS08_02525 [Candidatus Pacearchaeota archaeon]|nr:hypothetical protein [Candidatus Pacearchaeota archaeon]